jgi:hypothetical protein
MNGMESVMEDFAEIYQISESELEDAVEKIREVERSTSF